MDQEKLGRTLHATWQAYCTEAGMGRDVSWEMLSESMRRAYRRMGVEVTRALLGSELNHYAADLPCCECEGCAERRDEIGASFECQTCGYMGVPYLLGCSCEVQGDLPCEPTLEEIGPCGHGEAGCPVCRDGAEDGWARVAELRQTLRGALSQKEEQ